MSDVEMILCPACGATNRVPVEKLAAGRAPICGRCKAALPAASASSSAPFAVTDATFAAEVERSTLPVVVDLWAPWCGPCRIIAPMLDELAVEMAGRVRFAKLNVDDNPATASRFGVQGIPTLLVMRNGREIDRIVGVAPKAELARRVQQAIA